MNRRQMEGYDSDTEWIEAQGWCIICKAPCIEIEEEND